MKFFNTIIVVLLVTTFSDIRNYLDTQLKGSGTINSVVFLHGADALPIIIAAPAITTGVKAALTAITFVAGRNIGKKLSEHTKNKRPSTLGKHQNGAARKLRDQKRKEEYENRKKKG